MQTVFINTENSKTSELRRFRLDVTDKLNLKGLKKNMALVNLSITLGKTQNLKITTINLKFLLQLGMMLLIYQMVLIRFLTFRITLSLS